MSIKKTLNRICKELKLQAKIFIKNEESCSGLLWIFLEDTILKAWEDLMLKIRNMWLKKTWKDIVMESKLQWKYSQNRKYSLKMNKLDLVFMNFSHVSNVNV